MTKQIIYGSLEPGALDRAYDFLVDPHRSENTMHKLALDTDVGAENLFIKFAEEWKPKTFTEFSDKVHDTFDGKLDAKVARWEKKLSLDKTLVKQLFA